MKKLLLTTAILGVLAAPAFAADAITYEPAAPAAPEVPMVYDWSGFYVGVQGGYAWTSVGLPAGLGSEDFNGGLVGAHIGANWQSGNIVFGVEADVAYTFNDNDYSVFGTPVEIGTDWQGSARARLGYAFDRTMIYGTGGFAMTRGVIDAPGFEEKETFTGWTVGAGVEHAFTDNLLGRVEYRYSDYGSKDFGLGLGDIDLDEHTVRVGLSYKF